MKKKNINIAIVGCGRIAGHHCNSIVSTKGINLVGICDLEIDKAKHYGQQYGARPYRSYHKMLIENPTIDVVAIATPSGMHYEHALDIISRYKKSIIVEKPTFLQPSHVRAVYQSALTAGVTVFPVFQNRHNMAVKRVGKGLTNGELGEVRSVSVRVRWCRPQRYYDLAPWRGTYSMDGGCLANQGIHHIDLLRCLGGEVSRVCSIHKTLGADIEVEDTTSASIEFHSGAIGLLEITTAARPIDYEASLSLVCEKGLAQIGGIAVNELQVYTPDPDTCESSSEDFSGNIYGNGHAKMYEEISSFFHYGEGFSVTADDTYATVQLLNSFYLSDEQARWINVSNAGDSARLGQECPELANLYRSAPPLT